MTRTLIKDFDIKKSYSRLVQRAIVEYLREFIYQPLFDLLGVELKAQNTALDYETIINAIKRGLIYYDGVGFRARNKFSNRVAIILEKWGAKYSKYQKIYKLPKDKIPDEISVVLAEAKIQYETQLKAVDSLLADIQNNLSKYIDKMIFDDEVEIILDDAGQELKKNVRKISIIEIELDENQKAEIARNYTNNLKFYIKDFEEKRIPEMREKVQDMALKGMRPDSISEMLQKEYGIAQRKADFLAQNETSIMLAEVKKVQYQKMGFDKFIWRTITDGKERELHKELNGQVFRYDDPPIIDERTGERGLPGQTYNCRCAAIPFREDNPFSSRAGRFDPVDPLKYTNPTQRKKLEEKLKIASNSIKTIFSKIYKAINQWDEEKHKRDEKGRFAKTNCKKYDKIKSRERKEVQLDKDEYASVMSELNTNLSSEQRKKKQITKYIGNYKYTIENNGFNNYKIIGKENIDDID